MSQKSIRLNINTLLISILILVVIILGFLLLNKDSGKEEIDTEAEIRAKLEEELRAEEIDKEQETELNIDICYAEATKEYLIKWINYCQVNNIPIEEKKKTAEEQRLYEWSQTSDAEPYLRETGTIPGYPEQYKSCEIPVAQADEFERQLQVAKDRCVSRYK